MPCVVVLYHSGCEYTVDVSMLPDGVMPWNKGAHCRKFMEAEGEYVCEDVNVPKTAKLRFWGEWEPQSRVSKLQGKSPKFMHVPFVSYPLPALPGRSHAASCGATDTCGGEGCNPAGNLAATDPFVFGDSFYYTICQQMKKDGTPLPVMQGLEDGSLILFGSRFQGDFVLDTLFVVREGISYQTENIEQALSCHVSPDYPRLMQLSRGLTLKCYIGANYSNPMDGMYSFAPCRVSDGGQVGFGRPVISEEIFNSCGLEHHIMSDGQQNQGRKVSKATPEQARKIWECIRKSIRTQGYLEGVRFRYK